uniref:Uncharacterized protein n=1 Tax=Anguilla anguilla TaxID=7936 RepID=A0A0E9Q7R4_ANGAN
MLQFNLLTSLSKHEIPIQERKKNRTNREQISVSSFSVHFLSVR